MTDTRADPARGQLGGSAGSYQDAFAPLAIRNMAGQAGCEAVSLCLLGVTVNVLSCRVEVLDWRPGRVYFLTLLEPSRD